MINNFRKYNAPDRYGAAVALLSAGLFGMSAPLAKALLGGIAPLVLAGLLYFGSGAGLLLLSALRHLRGSSHMSLKEASLKGSDYLYLAGAIVSGGVTAPVLLMYGLSKASGTAASLLLNTEGILTVLIASLVFREPVGRRVWLATLFIGIAGLLVAYTPTLAQGDLQAGALLVVLACFMWGIDNNLTRHLSHRNPFSIAQAKGIAAGSVTLLIAALAGNPMPSPLSIAEALLLGALSYGASLVLFIYSLRHLGTSRAMALFGTAPFIGAVLSVLIFREHITLPLCASAVFMLAGAGLILRESHEHGHEHEMLLHEHRHIHDEHHNHYHEDGCCEPHCHEHEHGFLVHSHAHVPDLHHSHCHQ